MANTLAQSLLDGTVYEIVHGLEDIQQMTERNLLNRRMKLINNQKGTFRVNIPTFDQASAQKTKRRRNSKTIKCNVLYFLCEPCVY